MKSRIFSCKLWSARGAVGAAAMALALLPGAAGFAQGNRTANDPLVDTVANGRGRINYAAGVVKATGYGAPPPAGVASSASQSKLMALGAARADALRTLAMTVSSIQVTAETKVKNYVLQKDEVQTKLDALLQSPRIVSEATQADGTAVVVVELPMYGKDSIAAVIMPEILSTAENNAPERIENGAAAPIYNAPAYPEGGAGADANGNFKGPAQPAIPVALPPMPRKPKLPPGGEPGLTPLSDNGPFTCVLIDCRGLNMEAIMSPKVYDTTGREVYGTIRVTPEYAIETGIVGYPRSMAEALHTARCGSHPLIVRTLRVADKHRFNAVISLEDADRILAANNRDQFLEKTRVIFLVDPIK